MSDIISEHLSQEFASNIKLLLRDLLKLIKVLAMYPPDNPLPAKMRRSLSSRFAEVVNEFNGLSFVIQPDKIYYSKEEVFVDQGKEERLAGLFFDAGRLGFHRDFPRDVGCFHFLYRFILRAGHRRPGTFFPVSSLAVPLPGARHWYAPLGGGAAFRHGGTAADPAAYGVAGGCR